MSTLRNAVAGLSLSAAALVGLVMHEGYTDTAVQPLPGDKWTQGFGSTTKPDGSAVKPGDKTSPPQALGQALRDVRKFEGALKDCPALAGAELTQGEYDSLVHLAYNVGADAVCKSTMARLHAAGQHADACAQFDRWTMYRGRDCRVRTNNCYGLVERRANERAMCEGRA